MLAIQIHFNSDPKSALLGRTGLFGHSLMFWLSQYLKMQTIIF